MVTEIAKAFQLAKTKAQEKLKNGKDEADKTCPAGYLPWRDLCLPISIGF